MLKIISLNLLIDLSNWHLRGQCIVEEINRINPDIVAFQEVLLPFNTAQWVADRLEDYQVYIVPNSGLKGKEEALALLSRIPVQNETCLDLETQNRKAQIITFNHNHQPYILVNTHLFWQDGHSRERLQQAKLIGNYLTSYPKKYHKVICGDFNTPPNSPTIEYLQENFNSCLNSNKSGDKLFTYPSPLLNLMPFFDSDKQNLHQNTNEGRIIDYIFISKSLRSRHCDVVFTKPHPEDPKIFASDHYGIMAIIDPLKEISET